jgi:pyridoxine kinase
MAENGVEDPQDLLACICSTVSPANAEDPSTVFARCVPLIPGYFSGVGDLFSALVLGHYKPGTTDNAAGALAYATSAALSTTHAVLARTQKYYLSLPDNERNETDPELDGADPERRVIRQRGRELRLIQSQDLIRAPDAGVGPQAAMVPWSGFWTTS